MEADKVKDAYDLNTYLQERITDFISDGTHMGTVNGTLDGLNVSIDMSITEYAMLKIKDTYLPLRTITKLADVVSAVMKDTRPMCCYKLTTEDGNSSYVYEWNINKPEKRIGELANDRSHSDGSSVSDLTLYGKRDLKSYVKDPKKNRIFGLDPGKNFDHSDEEIEDEVSFWWKVHKMTTICNSRIEGTNKKTALENSYNLEYLAYQTRKFGVAIPDATPKIKPTESEEFNAWYRYYLDYFFSRNPGCLTGEQLDDYYEAREKGLDTSVFMPSGNWKDSLVKGRKKEKVSQINPSGQ